MFMVLATLCPGSDEIKTYLDHGKPKTYGNAAVNKILKVDALYSFSCDVTGWPAIIGSNIPVRIAGVTLPEIVTESGEPNKFFQTQLRQRLKTILAASGKTPKIELKKIRRDDTFGLIADVIVDSNSIADILISEGFARKPDDLRKLENNAIEKQTLVASKTSKIFHKSSCRHAKSMDPAKSLKFSSSQQAINTGRRACKTCKP
jgi:endonuclease YncB( thermonuclease family)